MSILSKVALKSKGKYLFYTVGKDSAVLVAVRNKNYDKSPIVIPNKIGKYTVRGIAPPDSGGHVELWNSLSGKQMTKLRKVLWNYANLSFFYNCSLPDTIEYVGIQPINSYRDGAVQVHDRYDLPKNVCYIENRQIAVKTLVLPKDIQYIGSAVAGGALEEIRTGNEARDEDVPHYSLSQYRGEKVADEAFQPMIVENAFSNHVVLKRVTLPDRVEVIAAKAFGNIGRIEQFHFPKRLKKIAVNAFEGTELAGEYRYPADFPAGLYKGNYDFRITGKIVLEASEHFGSMVEKQNAKDERLTMFASEIDLSALEGKLPDRAFSVGKNEYSLHCANKEQRIRLGDRIAEIGESAFEGNSIRALTLPAGLKRIGKNAFKDCPNLASLVLPDGVETVEEGAFETVCEIVISAGTKTHERIREQPGYGAYLQKRSARCSEANAFIERYKDYFNGQKTEKIPTRAELEKYWIDHGQNPRIYQKLLVRLKTEAFDREHMEMLVSKAQNLGLPLEAEEFQRIYTEKVNKSLQISKSDLPSDWLAAYKMHPENDLAFDKILCYLIDRYEKGMSNLYLLFINSFMIARSHRKQNPNIYQCKYVEDQRWIPYMYGCDTRYEKKIGPAYRYCTLERNMTYLPLGAKSPIKDMLELDRDLIKTCRMACKENFSDAYIWCELAVAFSPDFKPPKCPPNPHARTAKHSESGFASSERITLSFPATHDENRSTVSSTYDGMSEEEKRRTDEILSNIALEQRIHRYVGYLMDFTGPPSDLPALVDEFSGLSWDWVEV